MQKTLTLPLQAVNNVINRITGLSLEPNQPIRPLIMKKLIEYTESADHVLINELQAQRFEQVTAFDIINYILVYDVEGLDKSTIKFIFNSDKRFDEVDFNL